MCGNMENDNNQENNTIDMISFEVAVDRAMDFLRNSGYPFARLVDARKYAGNWVVSVDVGIAYEDLRKVRVHGQNGKIIGFEKKR
ncbi:MAG: hypothetical protein R6U52_00555 [Kosmotogaceae bacterium]